MAANLKNIPLNRLTADRKRLLTQNYILYNAYRTVASKNSSFQTSINGSNSITSTSACNQFQNSYPVIRLTFRQFHTTSHRRSRGPEPEKENGSRHDAELQRKSIERKQNQSSQKSSSASTSSSQSTQPSEQRIPPPEKQAVAPWEQPKASLGNRALNAVRSVPRHLMNTPKYVMIVGSKIIEISKLLLWALRHPILAKASIKKAWQHHILQPFKLMSIDLRAARKIWKEAQYENRPFTELEKRRLQAIGADVLRFVPFAFFLAIPALELLLPIYLLFFPGAKPGWFESRDEKDIKLRRKLESRLEMAKFMKASIETYEIKKQKKGEVSLTQFKVLHKKLKSTVEIEELQKYVPLFNTHLALEKLDTNNLKSMCHLLNIRTPPGIMSSDYWLRYLLINRMDRLRKQDEEFSVRGVDSMTDDEVIQSNIDRGGRGVGVSREQLNDNLELWVKMNYEYRLPIALILFTKAAHILPDPKTIVKATKEPAVATVPTKAEVALKSGKAKMPVGVSQSAALASEDEGAVSGSAKTKESKESQKLRVLSDLTFTVMKEIFMDQADLKYLYEGLEEMCDMVLIRDVSDDLREFRVFLEDEHLQGSRKRRNGKLTTALNKLIKDTEAIQKQTLVKKKEMLDDEIVKDVVEPDGFDNDGYILEEDFLLILSRILPEEAKFGKFDDAFLTQITRALNPHNHKFGIKIVTARQVVKNFLKNENDGTREEFEFRLFSIAEEMCKRTDPPNKE